MGDKTMKVLALVAMLTLSSGCATRQLSLYEVAAANPTPQTLAVNSKWAITLLDVYGHIEKSLVIRLTDRPAQICESGDYRQLEVISEQGTSGGPRLGNPAYEVKGAALSIQLSTLLCDSGYAVIGGVTSNGFEGIHMEEVLIAPKNVPIGRAYGVPVLD